MLITIISDEDLEERLDNLDENKLAIVEFMSPYCGLCLSIVEQLQIMSVVHETVVFLTADTKLCERNVDKYGIAVIPMFVAIKQGQCIKKIIGANLNAVEEVVKTNK
ncbi:unnamed protein product [Phyllotreta striolata]|uniref:Thioredoxin domain-containing protein n=1 Tax=Phyllotreta striolata TaxID=444603 RepID=A0A9P0GUR2_PHYSR|nr:unnamed protein product [Phyllotreta striolata]